MKGSKSFSLASLFFDSETKISSWYLYSWCRYCDDLVDFAKPEEIKNVVTDLRQCTLKALQGQAQQNHPWPALQMISAQHKLPTQYALDLIEGFERDALKKPIQDEADLLNYCYNVASAVGLMMCHIMTISSNEALKHAVALGRAMQMTNISRDVQEDFQHGRLYLPVTWLNEAGLNEKKFLEPKNRAQLYIVIRRLLAKAEENYQYGQRGLIYLPTRAAWAVASALRIYRAIGRKIENDIELSLNSRTTISKTHKILHVILASSDILFLLIKRFFQPFKNTQTIELWRKP